LILISFKLCAEPMIINFGWIEYERWSYFLLNEGIYTPSNLSFKASFILLASMNLQPFFLREFFNFKILSISSLAEV